MERLFDQNLMEVNVALDGAEISLSLVDAGVDAREMVLRCRGVVILDWNRNPPDTAPYIIPEISWEYVGVDAIAKLLADHGYRFYDLDGSVWHRFSQPLVHLNLEGAICADIICERIEVESE
jgi:hypothetical protein